MAFTEELLTELITCEKKKNKNLKKLNKNFEGAMIIFSMGIGVLAIAIFMAAYV